MDLEGQTPDCVRSDPEAAQTMVLSATAAEDREAPDFVEISGGRCGHRYAGIQGCRRCIAFCGHGAISPGETTPQIDSPACRECANCVTACPVDAIRMTVPDYKAILRRASVQAAESAAPCILVFHGPGVTPVKSIPPSRPILVEVEPIGALGMESILALLAAGAASVIIIPGRESNRRTLDLLEEQVQWARRIVAGLGYPGERIWLLAPGAEPVRLPVIPEWDRIADPEIPDFEQPKRDLALWAVEKLANRNSSGTASIALPAGAPYGEVVLDPAICSFCMACTSLCPTGALSTAGEIFPKLVFAEAECTQCGLCVSGCPEKALRLHPRMDVAAHLDRAVRSLKQEVPLPCERCGEPFATRSMIEAMTARLTGHWMFATDAEKRRLRLCRTCRVKDIYENPGRKDG